MESRMTGAISLGPSNMNGGYKIFSIIAGEILVRRRRSRGRFGRPSLGIEK